MTPWLGRKIATTATVIVAAVVGCQTSTPTILGYRVGNEALYDENISTVYVPVFKNLAFQTTPYRGMERDMTLAVVNQIGAYTPFRVVSDPDRADTELVGVISSITKNILNRNQQNTIREGEVVITVDLVWWDLRTGKIISSPRRGVNQSTGPGPKPQELEAFDPSIPLPPELTKNIIPQPVRIVSAGRMIPELGETNATAEQKAINNVAVQVVSMMEKPWGNGGRKTLNQVQTQPATIGP